MGSDGVTADIRADFLIEARDILDQLGGQIASLAQVPADREMLNAAFRGFHTIKGGAGFLGIAAMGALCHAVEDRLNLARGGEQPLDAASLDAVQEALDRLVDMLDAVGNGREPEAAPAALLQLFHVAAAPPSSPAPLPHAAVAARATAGDGIDDFDFEALLDSLHGSGGIPGAAEPTPAPVAAAAPAPAPVPTPAPAAPASSSPPMRSGAGDVEASVRVDVRRLDAIVNLVGELVLARNRLKVLRPRLRNDDLDRAVAALDAATVRLQSAVMAARMQPVGRVFSRFPKLARDIARQLAKQVALEVEGADTELDRNLVDALADPLLHLVRNAIDHGIESPTARAAAGKPAQGRVRLAAQQEGDHVAIVVEDDGAGIDPERLRDSACRKGLVERDAAARLSDDECLQLIFLPGFSTRSEVSDLSGRGVGMDVVQSRIRELGGQVQIQSAPGRGTRFLIRVPLTLAILPTLLVEIDDTVYALPLVRVVEVLALHGEATLRIDGRRMLDLRDRPVPVLALRDWLGLEAPHAQDGNGVILDTGAQRFCLSVDRVCGREEVVIKALPRALRGLPGYAGAALIGDGRMALILDVDALLETGLRELRAA
jgi:two-component system chemotaxis sensor kinase CheA